MKEIFENYIEFQDKSNEINKLFCDSDGRKFIIDVYNSFELEKYEKIVCITIDWGLNNNLCFNFYIIKKTTFFR